VVDGELHGVDYAGEVYVEGFKVGGEEVAVFVAGIFEEGDGGADA
jgi:hypothetical protein